MVLPMMSSQYSPHPWGISSGPASAIAKSLSSCSGFVCPPSTRSQAAILPSSPSSRSSSKLHGTKKTYSAEWIDLLSPESYPSQSSIPLPGKIDPPRSGAVSFSNPGNDKLFTFAGYAEVASAGGEGMPERYVVNDLWKFDPYNDQAEGKSAWGWAEVEQSDDEYIPGPRLATALAVLPGNDDGAASAQAVLLGGWDPQTPGTGGVILDDVSMLDLDSLKWSQANGSGEDVPGGPTSRHVAVPLSIKQPGKESIENVICLHNHRCEDQVLLLSTKNTDEGSKNLSAKWEHQPVTGDVPSSRGLHCAAPLINKDKTSKGMVIFGGAAQTGSMSNEAFALDVNTWEWTKLDCGTDENNIPSPRAGANLCSLDENTVLLFGGATPDDGGLVGLDDVWVLHIDMEGGKGTWQCLAGGDQNDKVCCPPGRNAATLTQIDGKSLPKDIVWKESAATSDDDDERMYYLLQGGWYPFRKTYDDVFLLRVSSN